MASPIAAKASKGEQQQPAVIFTLGGGARVYPRFPGDDGLGVHHMLIVYARPEGQPVPLRAPDQKFGLILFGAGSPVNAGLALNIKGRRREKNVGAPIGNVGWTAEAGGFIQAFVHKNVRLRAEARQGMNGHGGITGDMSADLFVRAGDLSVFSIGPRLRLASGKYVDAYYGIAPAAAMASGLPAFDPEGGIHAAGAVASMRLDVGRSVAVHAYGIYDRLMNGAADSPIVARFGSRNQFSAGLGLSFSFRVPLRPGAAPGPITARP
ncbi:MipA/OmpV family protein [Allosphingosinicella flava]|uniref:MipA/OmpV family protein n=1 Tax=Allosphingosinicella flava TaxID=2771430 RepID=A0A7T2GL14_9SPHN|nr:MipA/OmpV family protein [Sphingosinicella flava]